MPRASLLSRPTTRTRSRSARPTRADDPEDFAGDYGDGPDAFAKCVAEKADDDDEGAEPGDDEGDDEDVEPGDDIEDSPGGLFYRL